MFRNIPSVYLHIKLSYVQHRGFLCSLFLWKKRHFLKNNVIFDLYKYGVWSLWHHTYYIRYGTALQTLHTVIHLNITLVRRTMGYKTVELQFAITLVHTRKGTMLFYVFWRFFHRIEKRLSVSLYLSVCHSISPFAWNISAPNGRNFVN